jgi:hypothetical protein
MDNQNMIEDDREADSESDSMQDNVTLDPETPAEGVEYSKSNVHGLIQLSWRSKKMTETLIMTVSLI